MQMRTHSSSRASKRTGSVCQRSRKGVMVYLLGGFGPFTHSTTFQPQRATGAGVHSPSFLVHGGVRRDWRCGATSSVLWPLGVTRSRLSSRLVPCSRSMVSGTTRSGVSRAAIRGYRWEKNDDSGYAHATIMLKMIPKIHATGIREETIDLGPKWRTASIIDSEG